MTKDRVTACIDGSAIVGVVCDTAVWASKTLAAPLMFLHVLDTPYAVVREDLSGAIGLGSREYLLDELMLLDERRNKLALEQGARLLENAKRKAERDGAIGVATEQRHGHLLDAVSAVEDKTRLFVIGRQGEGHGVQQSSIGSQVETMVRAMHTPLLVATGKFSQPRNYMLAYDGSKTADDALRRIAKSPLLANIPGHVVMVGDNNEKNRQQLEQGCAVLLDNGHHIEAHLIQGNVSDSLTAFREDLCIELMVMGAYGHSRIREFIVGSNTTKMLAMSTVPVLILR